MVTQSAASGTAPALAAAWKASRNAWPAVGRLGGRARGPFGGLGHDGRLACRQVPVVESIRPGSETPIAQLGWLARASAMTPTSRPHPEPGAGIQYSAPTGIHG
jgi:hypothetical protein